MLPVYLIVLSLRISLSIYYSFACLWLFTLSVHRICVYHSLRRLSSTIDYLLAYIYRCLLLLLLFPLVRHLLFLLLIAYYFYFFFKKILISSLFCLTLIYLLSVGLSDILCLSFAFVSARLSVFTRLSVYILTDTRTHSYGKHCKLHISLLALYGLLRLNEGERKNELWKIIVSVTVQWGRATARWFAPDTSE